MNTQNLADALNRESCGMSTEARGVIVSMPVDDIEGLGSVTSYKAQGEGEQ